MKPEKPSQAVALRYERTKDRAPRVVAKGRGAVAESIIARAREHGVPLHEDANLAATLSALDLETEIGGWHADANDDSRDKSPANQLSTQVWEVKE